MCTKWSLAVDKIKKRYTNREFYSEKNVQIHDISLEMHAY